jgi:branched-chain amino acid transport system substrate-binding protein
MEVIAEHGMPTITPGASSPAITSAGNAWISRGIPDDSLQSRILVKWAKEEDKITKLGFIYANDDYGRGGYKAAADAAADYGVELVAESFMGDDQNFTSLLSKLKDAGCQGLMVWCVYTPGSLIFKQMQEMGWETPRYAPPGVNNPAVFELSGGAIDGVLLTTGFVLADPDPFVQAWIERYKARYNEVPSQTAAVGYDSIKIIAEAIERAGNTEDLVAIQREIRSTKNFKSLKGLLSINPATGDYGCEVRLVRANKEIGDFDYIRSYDL